MCNFLKSVLLGSIGTYCILGTPIEFKKEYLPFSRKVYSPEELKFYNSNAGRLITQGFFLITTQGYAKVFVHEVCHAIAVKLLLKQNTKITIFTKGYSGMTESTTGLQEVSDWKKSIISVAGPMGSMAFSTCKLVALTALKSYIPRHVALTLGGGAIISMSLDLEKAYLGASSKCKDDIRDFARIKRHGANHLAVASSVLVAQYALGIFVANKLQRNLAIFPVACLSLIAVAIKDELGW
ncbi:MAG: M50 family metallopeptidase [Chlamydiae bacterium]|nr:M50 family metallopeptidase [Chlamydiota bacterium]